MKIINLQAENVKRLSAVEIAPDGNLVEITGRNGAGKTSVLDAIWWALAGASTHQAEPIRRGAEAARIRLDLGEVKVERTFRRRKGKDEDSPETITTAVKVETAKGARWPSPQAILDGLMGRLAFDPLAFCRADSAEQAGTLRRIAGLDVSDLDDREKTLREERRDIGRDGKALGETPDPGDPVERIEVSEVMSKLSDLRDQAADIRAMVKAADDLVVQTENDAGKISRTDDQIKNLTAQIKECQDRKDRLIAAILKNDEEAKGLRDQVDEMADPNPAIEAAETELRNADVRNRAADSYRRRMERVGKRASLTAAYEAKTAEITAVLEERGKRIADADMPLDGLALDAEGRVTFGGLPLDQASDEEQLRVGCSIAAAGNPTLRVIRIREGSLIDDQHLAGLREWAEGTDYQVWIERVDSSGTVGFVIEDGALKGAEGGDDGKE